MSQASTPAAWLVDLDGTLYRGRWLKLAMVAELTGASPRCLRVLRRFRAEHERLRLQTERSPDPFRAQVERTAASLGMAEERILEIVEHWMLHRPRRWLRRCARRALIEEIAGFKARGGAVAVVSDYPARLKLESLGCARLPDVVVACGEPGGPGFLKPHPEGYLAAAQRLGVPPERCLVVGDRADADGQAAERAGMGYRRVA